MIAWIGVAAPIRKRSPVTGSFDLLRRIAAYSIPRLSFVAFGVGTAMAAIYTPIAAPKDWRLYYDTAVLLLSGRVSELYPGITEGYPFLYPPPFVWQVAWLGFLSPGVAHLALVLVMAAALGAALWMLHRGLDVRGRPLGSWAFVVLSSAGWLWTLSVGHIAAWFVLLVASALLLWTSGRELAAGMALGCVAIKPHYCIPILLCAMLARAWRVLGGALVVIALLALTTVPLGLGVWTRYFEQFGTSGGVISEIPPWKQITLLAFWRSLLGDDNPWMTMAATMLSAAPFVLLVGLSWIRVRPVAGAVPRLLALTVLMLLSCNVYAFHYDGLLLTISGAVWYLRGDDYESAGAHFATGVVILLAYAAQHASAMLFQGGLALTGPLLAAWLVIDARDLLRNASRPSHQLTYPSSHPCSDPAPSR
jgi:hypothetical protein